MSETYPPANMPRSAGSVDDRPAVTLSPQAVAATAARNRAREALAAPAVPLSDCTHGGDCPIHPGQLGVHDYTPGAVQALNAVLIQVRWLPVTENVLRQVVAALGLDWDDVERGY